MDSAQVVRNGWLQCDPGQIGPKEHFQFYDVIAFEKEYNGYHFIKVTTLLFSPLSPTKIPLSTTFQLKKGCYIVTFKE